MNLFKVGDSSTIKKTFNELTEQFYGILIAYNKVRKPFLISSLNLCLICVYVLSTSLHSWEVLDLPATEQTIWEISCTSPWILPTEFVVTFHTKRNKSMEGYFELDLFISCQYLLMINLWFLSILPMILKDFVCFAKLYLRSFTQVATIFPTSVRICCFIVLNFTTLLIIPAIMLMNLFDDRLSS